MKITDLFAHLQNKSILVGQAPSSIQMSFLL